MFPIALRTGDALLDGLADRGETKRNQSIFVTKRNGRMGYFYFLNHIDIPAANKHNKYVKLLKI